MHESPALLPTALHGLALAAAIAGATWLASLWRRDASLIDRCWSLMIALPGLLYLWLVDAERGATSARAAWAVGLALLWGLRLCIYVTRRNWGHGEDRRYREIRARNQPNFEFKSLYLVFALQAVLAWIVGAPLLVAVLGDRPMGWLDGAGVLLTAFGIAFEAVADAQMAHFKSGPTQEARVMDRGLWRYSRHPNYFGECCIWWGLWLLALGAAGPAGAWSVVSPLLMTWLLLRVSGVRLLEKDIADRRPAYRGYVARTNAFVPGPPRRGEAGAGH